MKKSYSLLILIMLLILVGCDSHSDYEKQILNYLEVNLKDFDSAKYKFEKPLKVKINGDEADVILYSVNSKNSFGAYTGYKDRVFAFFYDKDKQYKNGDITEGLNVGFYKIEYLNKYSDMHQAQK
ncbi:hypothetical protein J3U18_06975 [Gilliamella sp. B3482]|uniref:hypothetical protein n=1 Tax=Gilliamella sp. B3482 TaxID=2817991 RepID=UPI00226A1EF7|nr:hypothetical protein [Gilliamella sp. B3482]MCX8581430.1 hypothetical protein [Gilliamella sp. B3482]